jgi:hypothetical protein
MHAWEAFDEGEELLLGAEIFTNRVKPGIKLQPHTHQRVGRVGVIIEGNDPEPAAAEDVMQRSFGEPKRHTVVFARRADIVVAGHIDHMRKDRTRLGLQVVAAPAELLRQQRARTSCIDDIVAAW